MNSNEYKKPDKKELKAFSKNNPEARKASAEEVKRMRKAHFISVEAVKDEIASFERRVEAGEMEVAEVVDEIRALESALAEQKQSVFSRFMNYRKIRILEEKIKTMHPSLQSRRDQIEKDYREMTQRSEDLQRIETDESSLRQARKSIDDFYQQQEKAWNDYQEDLKIRDVGNIVRENDCYFIHGIQPFFIPGANSLLRDWVDWETKLKILLTFNPTLSTSTIKEGDGPEKMWNRMGVILNGGKVINAGRGDMGSVAKGIQKRHVREDVFHKKPIREEITEAIHSPNRTTNYNELTVENPSICGFYICLDEFSHIIKADRILPKIIFETIKKLGIPMYIIKQGSVYEAEYNDHQEKFVSKEKCEPQEILDKPFQLPDEPKEKIFQEILADAPFRIKSPEVRLVNCRAFGREAYLQIHAQRLIAQHKTQASSKKPSPTIPIAEFPRIGEKIQCEIKGGELLRRERDTHSKVIRESPIKGSLNSINLGAWGGYPCAITTSDDYFLEAMRLSEKYQDESIAIAFHLYGYAEQAKALGDLETAEKAEKIAGEVLSREQYQGVLDRRIDQDGRLQITERDLDF